MLEIRCLSRPRVRLDGEVIGDFISNKALALLLYLALAKGPQSRGDLAALFWGELPGKRARGNLRVALHNLNEKVPNHLQVTRKEVSFDQNTPHWIDVHEFVRASDDENDLRTLARAVTLYEEDFLSGLHVRGAPDIEAWFREQQESLRLHLVAMLDRLAEMYETQRQWHKATAVARRLLAIEPWREASHKQLIRLLARQGEYDAALAQYEECRALLAQELGVTPTPATERLYERIRQLRDRQRHNLPPASTPLVDREEERAALLQRLDEPACRLLTIVGLGGIGKSRLALAVAQAAVHDFLDGVFYVPLAPLTSAQDLATTIADTVQAPPGNRSAKDELLDFLEDKEVLLLLDNYEHLLPDVSLVKLILNRCLNVKMLVTSRARLQLRSEWLYDLTGMAVDGDSDGAPAPAAELFLYHARRVQSNLEITKPVLAAITEVCEAVEGLPLAIELAAAGVRQQSTEEIAKYVRRAVPDLSTNERDVPQRHRSIAAAFDHSWNLLRREERRVLASLALFRSGFSFEAATQVAKANNAVLASLVEKCLLHADTADRYSMHELLRQYAVQKAASVELDLDDVATRHMRYYAGLLASEPPGTPAARQKTAENLDNIRLAWDTAVQRASHADLVPMLLPVVIFYYGRRRWHEEAQRRLAAAVDAIRVRDDVARPEVQRVLGRLTASLGWFTDDPEMFFQLTDEGVKLLRPLGPGFHLAWALSFRGDASYAIGRPEAALADLKESRTLFEEMGELLGLSAPLNSLTQVYGFLGDYEAAESYGEECIAVSDQIGLQKMSSIVRSHLSNAMRATGDYERAESLAREALAIADEIGSTEHRIISLIRLAEVEFDSGRYESAEERLATLLNMPELATEQPLYQVHALTVFARLCQTLGRIDEAQKHLQRALGEALEMRAIEILPRVLMAVAITLEDDAPALVAELLLALSDHRYSDAEIKAEATERLQHLAARLDKAVLTAARRQARDADLWKLAEGLELREQTRT